MATVNATISLASDITDNSISVTNTGVLYKAGGTTGLDTMTSVTKRLTSTNQVDLITTEEIGRLYGGDWMWFPWDVDDDICITPSVSTEMVVEYQVFS